MKFGFVTCVQLGESCIDAIYQVGGKLSVVITLPDNVSVKKTGRVYLDEFCKSKSIPLIKNSHVNDRLVIDVIKKYEIDWLFIIGWSQIANQELLNTPKRGVLGMHPTLLPQGRGRAAIPWAIIKGLSKTGVTLFQLDAGVDTGPIAAQIVIPLAEDETAAGLYDKVERAHVELMKEVIPKLMNDTLTLIKQDEELATEWEGRKPDDGKINLDGSVYEGDRLIRAVTRPYPGAFFYDNNVKTIVWKAKVVSTKQKNSSYLSFHDGMLLLEDIEIVQME